MKTTATTTTGNGITATRLGFRLTVLVETAGGSGISKLGIHTGSVAKNGKAGAPTATLHGTGMSAMKLGGSLTATAT